MTTFRSVARADFEVVRRTKRKVKANKAHQTKNCSKTRDDSFPFIRSYDHKIERAKHYLTWLIRAISGHLSVCERLGKNNVQATAAKTVLKKPSELALLQSSSRLFQFTSYFSCQKKADCPRDEFLGITSEFRKRKKISS